MKPYLIKFWHGVPVTGALKTKLYRICQIPNDDNNLFFDHTLEDFIKEWKDKFLFYPPLDRERPFISGTIYVTEYETF